MDDFVDAATRLFAEGGVRALTMNAVAREISAPSGSIYHRFPDRAALLAAMWFRTTGDFQRGYLDVLGDPATPAGAVRAAQRIRLVLEPHLRLHLELERPRRVDFHRAARSTRHATPS